MAFDPQNFSAEAVIKASLGDIGVISLEEGETVSAAMAADALKRLNALISTLATQRLTIPFIDREVFTVAANTSTYTIGPGGDFDTVRPTQITGAALLLNSSSPAIEIPSGLLTDDAYESIAIKDLTALLWTAVYYNPTFSSGLGTIFLWPTPTTGDNDFVLYRGSQLAGFTDLTTAQSFPPGTFEMLQGQLSKRLCVPYQIPIPPALNQMASETLNAFKRQNLKIKDAMIDPAMTHDQRGWYNILTGTGGSGS